MAGSLTTSSNSPAGGNGAGCALVAFGVISAALPFLVSVNEYAAMFGNEMAGAYDCNGPDTVLAFSALPFVLATAGVFLSVRTLRVRRSRRSVMAVCLGVAVLCAVTVRASEAVAELQKNNGPDSPCR